MRNAVFIIISATLMLVESAFGGDDSVPKPINSGAAYSRLCGEADLKGLWRVVKWTPYMEVKGADWRESLFLRHQWIEFDGNGHLKSVASNKKMNFDKVVELLAKVPWGVTISFKRNGFFEISSETKKYPGSIWRCVVITRNISVKSRKLDLREGDVIMTLLGYDESILYFRQVRKARPADPAPIHPQGQKTHPRTEPEGNEPRQFCENE
ncbi:MAG: hypothetical protein KAG97_03060 [Victivallales bacterium]|nr:hypothetical protein [Victivallales bacterium]